LTDLSDHIFLKVPEVFKNYNYYIFTLILDQKTVESRISARKLEQSGFDDLNFAIDSNRFWIASDFVNQSKIDCHNLGSQDILDLIHKPITTILSTKN